MKKYILLLPFALLFTSCFFYAGINGSGRLVSTTYSTSGFYAVKASDASDVTISYSDHYSITLICDDNLVSYINLHSDGYYLYIEMLPGYSVYNSTFTVNITMPDINALFVEDASNVQLSGFNLNDNLNLDITDAAKVDIYLTDANNLTVSVSDASSLQVSSVYPVENLDIYCEDLSTADFKDMLCTYAEITVTGMSSLRVNMAGSIIGQVTDASTLFFRGTVSPGPILFSGASGIVYY